MCIVGTKMKAMKMKNVRRAALQGWGYGMHHEIRANMLKSSQVMTNRHLMGAIVSTSCTCASMVGTSYRLGCVTSCASAAAVDMHNGHAW
jgi:hypothetical protein